MGFPMARNLLAAGLPDERRRMSRGAFSPPGFQLALGLKDIRLVLRTADQLGAPMPVAGVAYDHFLSAASRGRGGLDWTAVSEVVHEAAGLAPAWGASTSDPGNVGGGECASEPGQSLGDR